MSAFDLIIIGGGASGLTAAVTASSMGLQKIAVLERLPKTGRKILATGNGRCNLSHENITSKDYAGSYDTTHVLSAFGSAETFFENLGLYTRKDAQGRIYPYSMTANAVLETLRMHCRNSIEFCGERVVQLCHENKRWHMKTESGMHLTAQSVIFAAGGAVASQFGTDGSAWKMLTDLHIPVTKPKAILCPVLSDKHILQKLKGIRVKGSVSLYHQNHILKTETGEIQFTEQTVSGICVFNLVSLIDKNFAEYQLAVHLFPEINSAELLDKLYACQSVRYDADCENMLSGLLSKALANVLLKQCGIRASAPCSQLSHQQLGQLARKMQDFRFPVVGLSVKQAQATAGGVQGQALDEWLQARACPDLYITGEAVDVHADCGGYQLHWAWASGYSAAKCCAGKTDIRRK